MRQSSTVSTLASLHVIQPIRISAAVSTPPFYSCRPFTPRSYCNCTNGSRGSIPAFTVLKAKRGICPILHLKVLNVFHWVRVLHGIHQVCHSLPPSGRLPSLGREDENVQYVPIFLHVQCVHFTVGTQPYQFVALVINLIYALLCVQGIPIGRYLEDPILKNVRGSHFGCEQLADRLPQPAILGLRKIGLYTQKSFRICIIGGDTGCGLAGLISNCAGLSPDSEFFW